MSPPNPSSATSKSTLRRKLRSARRALTPSQQHAHAKSLTQNTLQTLLTLRFRRFALYLAADGEINTWPLINKLLSLNLLVGLPCLHRNVPRQRPLHLKMYFAPFTSGTTLVRGHYDLLEPRCPRSQHPGVSPIFVPDVVFTPLVGFDRSGNRLGMGGGFYDRYNNPLERSKPALRIGLAHELQHLTSVSSAETLPVDAWDKPLDGVITEQRVHGFSTRGKLCLT